MPENKKYVELLWHQKYDKIELGEKIQVEKPNLPFQVVETINKPRLKELEEGLFDPSQYYPENEYPENNLKYWKNLLFLETDKPFYPDTDFIIISDIVVSSDRYTDYIKNS